MHFCVAVICETLSRVPSGPAPLAFALDKISQISMTDFVGLKAKFEDGPQTMTEGYRMSKSESVQPGRPPVQDYYLLMQRSVGEDLWTVFSGFRSQDLAWRRARYLGGLFQNVDYKVVHIEDVDWRTLK